MKRKRQPRREAGADNALGRAFTNSQSISPITKIRHRIARWLAPDLIWNPDMSLELDYWIDAYESACIEIERLQSLVDTSSHKGGAA